MTIKPLVPAALMALGLCIPAYAMAQDRTAPPTEGLMVKSLQELDDDETTVRWNNLTVDQIEGMEIVSDTGETVGTIDEVLADADGNVVAVSAEVGGFLGIGEKEVLVSVHQITLQGDRFTTSLSAEQMEALPRWDDD